ncbi:hypothetical protein KIPB_010853, partial [Kipferlia bialata]
SFLLCGETFRLYITLEMSYQEYTQRTLVFGGETPEAFLYLGKEVLTSASPTQFRAVPIATEVIQEPRVPSDRDRQRESIHGLKGGDLSPAPALVCCCYEGSMNNVYADRVPSSALSLSVSVIMRATIAALQLDASFDRTLSRRVCLTSSLSVPVLSPLSIDTQQPVHPGISKSTDGEGTRLPNGRAVDYPTAEQ